MDEASVRALRFAFQRLTAANLAIVLTAQSEVPTADRLRQLLGDDQFGWTLRRTISLEPMTPPQIKQFVAECWGQVISTRAAADLSETTGGMPLLINLAMEQTGGRIEESASNPWQQDVPMLSPHENPFAAVTRRVEDPAVRRCIELVCAAGDSIRRKSILRAANLLGEHVDVDGALSTGLVVSTTRQDQEYLRAHHQLFAAGVRRSIAEKRRDEIHLALAEVVDDQHLALTHRLLIEAPADDTLLSQVTASVDAAVQAGDHRRAVGYLRAAADHKSGEVRGDLIVDACLVASAVGQTHDAYDLLPAIEALPSSALRDFALLQLTHVHLLHRDLLVERFTTVIDQVQDHPDCEMLSAFDCITPLRPLRHRPWPMR